jgi:hypothetical protein
MNSWDHDGRQGTPVPGSSPKGNLDAAASEGNLDVNPSSAGTRVSGLGQSAKNVKTGVRRGVRGKEQDDAHADS